MSKIVVRKPELADAANAYFVAGETQRVKGSAMKLTATARRERGAAYRAASEMLKDAGYAKSGAPIRGKRRGRRTKEPVDRLTPEPGRYGS